MGPPRRLAAFIFSTTALLVTGVLVVPSAGASVAQGPPVSVSLEVSTTTLPSSGGSVVVHLRFRHASRCRLFASSQVRGERRWGSCAGVKAERLWFPAQGSSTAPLDFRLIASGSSPGASASSTTTVTVGRSLAATSATSSNWSGLVATGVHGEVGATWVVPALIGCSTTVSESATWVGLGTQRIVQGGTDQACDPSTPGGVRYRVWTEAYPAPQMPAFPVAPGEVIHATATQAAGVATITVTDEMTGRSVSSTFSETPPLQGAEWVEEDPSQRASLQRQPLLPFSDFGSVVFSGMSLDGGLPAATGDPLEQFLIEGTSLRMSAGIDGDRLAVIDVHP